MSGLQGVSNVNNMPAKVALSKSEARWSLVLVPDGPCVLVVYTPYIKLYNV
jgi:hypothetical protein